MNNFIFRLKESTSMLNIFLRIGILIQYMIHISKNLFLWQYSLKILYNLHLITKYSILSIKEFYPFQTVITKNKYVNN